MVDRLFLSPGLYNVHRNILWIIRDEEKGWRGLVGGGGGGGGVSVPI